MGGRGRGRGRGGATAGVSGFGRGKLFGNTDQINLSTVEKVPTTQHSSLPYPVLEHFPAILFTDDEEKQKYEELLLIRNQISEHFQSSNFYLKLNDDNSKLFSLEDTATVSSKKPSLNFNWDYFPLELRPTSKRKLKDQNEILASLRKSKLSDANLATWLDKLEEKEKTEVQEMDVVKEETDVKKATEEPKEEEEEEEFDDEELDDGTDYNTNYFDNGEGYLDEDDDLDEGPCY